jgi:sugar phosphate isomerase/epimerase
MWMIYWPILNKRLIKYELGGFFMDRRKFIKGSVLPATSMAVLGSSAFAQSIPKRIGGPKLKLSLNAYSFNKHLRDGKISLDELLEFCAKLGFDAVDPTGYYFPGHPTPPSDEFLYEFKRKAFILGLDISGTGIRNDFAVADKTSRQADKKHIKDWIEVSAKMGAPVLRVFAGKKIPDGYTWDQTAQWMADDLGECADYAAKYGVIIALQNHAGFIKTADQVLKIFKLVNSKWMGLHLDIGSFLTDDPYKDVEKVVSLAVNWQIKENVKTSNGPQETDLPRLFEIIRQGNYRGYLPLETLGPGDPYDKVAKFLEKVRKVMG